MATTKENLPQIVEMPAKDYNPFPDAYREFETEVCKYAYDLEQMLQNRELYDRDHIKNDLMETATSTEPRPGMWFVSNCWEFHFSFGFVVSVKHADIRDYYRNGNPKKCHTVHHYMLCLDRLGNLKSVEYKISDAGEYMIPYRIYLKPGSENERPCMHIERKKKENEKKEEQRLGSQMSVTVGMWEEMKREIRALKTRIAELESDLERNYARIPDPYDE